MRDVDAIFEGQRPMLVRLAYRMLGSMADAEDILQDAYLRWSGVDRGTVETPQAYLSSIVVRLSLDRRRRIDARKESYLGPWLPEPLVEAGAADPARPLEKAETVSMALLVVLERLGPHERAAYLLRRIFDFDYARIAHILEKSEAACRQLVSRAEAKVHEGPARFDSDPAQVSRLTEAFLNACSTGDLDALIDILAPDAVAISDGGGRVKAARAPIHGAGRIGRFFLGIFRKAPEGTEIRRMTVNGLPGLVSVEGGRVHHVIAIDGRDDRIRGFYIMRNPEKLSRVEQMIKESDARGRSDLWKDLGTEI